MGACGCSIGNADGAVSISLDVTGVERFEVLTLGRRRWLPSEFIS